MKVDKLESIQRWQMINKTVQMGMGSWRSWFMIITHIKKYLYTVASFKMITNIWFDLHIGCIVLSLKSTHVKNNLKEQVAISHHFITSQLTYKLYKIVSQPS